MGVPKALGEFASFTRNNAYALYVLMILTLIYMVNQLNTFCLVATNPGMSQEIGYGDRECDVDNRTALELFLQQNNRNITPEQYCEGFSENCISNDDPSFCYWHYLGKGVEYQLLAGPLFIVLFSVSGIPMGLMSELNNINRKYLLVACALLWSLMCVLGGFATEYWHLAITRLLMGVFSAGCVPFCASLISDYFTAAQRGSALGLYNWGVYVGYSITFALIIAEKDMGWRAVYFIAGAPGILLSLVTLATVKEPQRTGSEKTVSQVSGTFDKLKTAVLRFSDPRLLLLCLGGAIRNGGGIVWAYNITIFFEDYHEGTLVEDWMTWIPLIFGSIGAFGGGALSDKLSRGRGTAGRLAVLIACLVLSAPFQVGTLLLPMPWAFIMQMPAYAIGEMWIGVCVAVVIDLVPSDLTASAVAVYFFIIQFIGGNFNVLVPPIENALGLRAALLIMFPGVYIVGAVIFILTLLVVLKKGKSSYDMGEDIEHIQEEPASEVKSNTQLVKET